MLELCVRACPWKVFLFGFVVVVVVIFCLFLWGSFWPCLWHAEVPGPGMEPEPQQWKHQVLNLLSHLGTPKMLILTNIHVWSSDAIQYFSSYFLVISYYLHFPFKKRFHLCSVPQIQVPCLESPDGPLRLQTFFCATHSGSQSNCLFL